jgi:hypothetical protein
VLDAAIGAGKGKLTGEMALIRRLHGRLRPGDIMLADSYYSSFDEVVTLAGMGVDVVMRQHGSRRSDFRRGTRLGHEDHLVQWQRSRNRPAWMSREEFAALPGAPDAWSRSGWTSGFRTKVFVVVTTLLDRGLPAAGAGGALSIAMACGTRYQIHQANVEDGRAAVQDPGDGAQEIWGHFLVYNLIRGVMAEAASCHGLLPRELSLQGARQTVAGFRAEQAQAEGELAVVLRAVALRAIASHRVGDRPDRVEPRVVKRRPKAYPRMHESRQSFKKRKRLVPAA